MDKRRIGIVGGGLAGTFLAARLVVAGHEVLLIDEAHPSSASRVAAGLFNVITGRFGAKSWMAETLLDEISRFYEYPLFHPLRKYIHYTPIFRPFREVKEYNKWVGRAVDPDFSHLVRFEEHPVRPDVIKNPLGGIFIQPCGWVETGRLIDEMQTLLGTSENFTLVSEKLDFDHVDLAKNELKTQAGTFCVDRLVCCEGHWLSENPLFKDIPIIPNKGETLTIEAPDLNLSFVLSKKIYLIPLGNHQYVTGSTYKNRFETPSPTPEGRQEICAHLEAAISVPYKILDHQAGIRPTTPNRRPILGVHPHHESLFVFSGFGTKGILLSAYFSKCMAEFITTGKKSFPFETDYLRFC